MRNNKVVGFGATYTRGFMVITDVILLLPMRSFRPAPISQNDSVVEHIWVIWWMIYNATIFVANNILYYNLNSVVLHFCGEPQYSSPFLSFINDETVQVGEIFPYGGQRPLSTRVEVVMVMHYRCKKPGHQQSFDWPSSPGNYRV